MVTNSSNISKSIEGQVSDSKKKKRNYKSEYQNYQGKPEQIKRRAKRNAARAKMEKAGKVSKGDGKDVAHSDNNTNNNSSSNLKVQTKKQNRSFPRDKNARRKRK